MNKAAWNDLTEEQKLAHRQLVRDLGKASALAEQALNDSSAWIGKNGPSAAPFGRETVETRKYSTLFAASEAAHKAHMDALTLYA